MDLCVLFLLNLGVVPLSDASLYLLKTKYQDVGEWELFVKSVASPRRSATHTGGSRRQEGVCIFHLIPRYNYFVA